MTDLDKPGLWMMAVGIAALGVIGLATGQLIEGLQPFNPVGPILAIANGGILVVTGLALLVDRFRRSGAMVLILMMVLSLVSQAPGLLLATSDVTLWVAAAQTVAIAATAILLIASDGARVRLTTRIVVGAMLILFGAVHLMYREAIAGMIPAWTPGQSLWPYATGVGQIAAGLAIVSGFFARPAAALIGAMFASWVLVVHAPRVAAAPSNGSEWSFMAMALVLAGVVWIARRALPASGGDFQSHGR